MKLLIALGVSFLLLSCAKQEQRLETAKNLSFKKYAGEWHEIARLPNFFERELVAARATYCYLPDTGKLSVVNEGKKSNGELTRIAGAAEAVGNTPAGEAKLTVRFDRFPASLFAGKYWILHLNEAHTRAVVGTPNRKFLWLLAKDPADQVTDFGEEIALLKKQGFDMKKLIINPERLK